jgi:hypothetical protein
MTTTFHWLAPAVALSLPWLAHAQVPIDPAGKVPAPELRYQSTFSDYKPWQDIKRGDWRQLNDNVRPAPKGANGHGHMPHGHRSPATAHPPGAQHPASAPALPAPRDHHRHGGKP